MTSENLTILIIDDDENNIEILKLDMEDEGYEFITANNGEQGWERLKEAKTDIDAILLDRMMPVMDGMQFMQKHSADESVTNIPVVMQTAAASNEQIAEGIEAGVYYYLTKPYQVEVMLSVVRAAIREFTEYKNLKQTVKEHSEQLQLVQEIVFEFKTVQQARSLSGIIAGLYPSSDRTSMGVLELLLNAVEHGNLAITYDEKSQLNEENRLEQEIVTRQQSEQYSSRKVVVRFKREENYLQLEIQDEGDGFDWQPYLEVDLERAMDNHGRGIAMANKMSFDELEYKGNGNHVVTRVNLAA